MAFGAKDGVFVYEVRARVSSRRPHRLPTRRSEGFDVASWRASQIREDGCLRFHTHVRRGRRDQRVTALRLLAERGGGEVRVLCGGEEGGVQLWDAATCALVAQQRKHSGAEVTAVASADPALVVAGDQRGRISVWKRDECVLLGVVQLILIQTS